MKLSDHFEMYFILGFLILFSLYAVVPLAILPEWARNEDLRYVGWLMITGLCMGAIGMVRQWADRHENKWLLLLAAPPAAVLAYEGWYILKRMVVGLARDPATLWTILFLMWVFLTWWLWEERREYKKDLKFWRERPFQQQPSRCPHCGKSLS